MSKGWRKWCRQREWRFPKYQELVVGERYFLNDHWGTNFYFRFRQGSVPGIRKYKASHRYHHGWRSQSTAEKRDWYDYEDQMKENGFESHLRSRRNSHSLITTYDDFPRYHYRGSWKQSSKKRQQWGNLRSVIFCG